MMFFWAGTRSRIQMNFIFLSQAHDRQTLKPTGPRYFSLNAKAFSMAFKNFVCADFFLFFHTKLKLDFELFYAIL